MIKLTLVETELSERLKWLINLRWLFVIGAVFVVFFAYFVLKVIINPFPIYLTLFIVILGNIVFFRISRIPSLKTISDSVPEPAVISVIKNENIFANIQIFFDFVVVWFLIFFSGGLSNFFILYFVFHVIIASIILSRKAAYVQTTVAVFLIALMTFFDYFQIIPQNYEINIIPDEPFKKNIYCAGLFFILASTLYLSVFMATSIVKNMRAKQDELMLVKESLERRVKDLRRLNSSLLEADQARFEYVMKVTHELRSPLATIKNCLQIITKGYVKSTSDEIIDIISRAEKKTDGLLDLINDLLSLSYLKSGKKREEVQTIIFREVIENVYNLFSEYAKSKNISFMIDIDPSLPAINGYKSNIERLIINLVSNAIKYTLPGGTVTVKISPKNGGVRIQVVDTGIGIPEEEQKNLFTDFYRTKQARKLETHGTGLGLAIIEQIVKQHKGTISFFSRENTGTTFDILLNNTE